MTTTPGKVDTVNTARVIQILRDAPRYLDVVLGSGWYPRGGQNGYRGTRTRFCLEGALEAAAGEPHSYRRSPELDKAFELLEDEFPWVTGELYEAWDARDITYHQAVEGMRAAAERLELAMRAQQYGPALMPVIARLSVQGNLATDHKPNTPVHFETVDVNALNAEHTKNATLLGSLKKALLRAKELVLAS